VTTSGNLALPLLGNGTTSPVAMQRGSLMRLTWPRTIALAATTLAIGVVLGVFFKPDTEKAVPAQKKLDAATSMAANTVGALGRLMPEGDLTTLAMPFGAGDARVARLLVREGQRVALGQSVAELDNIPQRLAQRDKARAELAAAQAKVDQARSAARLNLAEAHSASDRARAEHVAADRAFKRVLELSQVGMATRAQLDQVESTNAQTVADLAKAEASVQRFSSQQLDLQPDVKLALRNLDVAKAALAQAEQELATGRVAASIDGTVIAIHVRSGEKPGDRGIATLGNTDRMAAELEVYQTDVGRIAVGQTVLLSAALLETPLRGKVSQVGLEVRRQALLAADPVSNTDARVVRIWVTLDPPSSERCRALSGLQVIGRISVSSR
jgi:HlyD family secretion protein